MAAKDKYEHMFLDKSLLPLCKNLTDTGKTKRMTFFSSVSRGLPDVNCGNISSDNCHSGSCDDNDIAKDTKL